MIRAQARRQPPGAAGDTQVATESRFRLSGAPDASVGHYGASGTVSLTLPYPVSTNRLYRNARRGRAVIRVKTQEAKAYQARVEAIVLGWVLERGGFMAALPFPDPPFRLTFSMYPPSRRRIDASNGIKLAEDSIFNAFGLNDKTVNDVRITVCEIDAHNPRLEAVLQHMPAPGTEDE